MERKATLLTLVFFVFFFWATAFPAQADVTYVVKSGDSLHAIAQKFKVAVKQLQEANELDSSKIKPGQRLVIPLPESATAVSPEKKGKKAEIREEELPELNIPETHVVKKGETLAKIAHRYHLRLEDLEEINQLPGKKLRIGQIIYLQKINEPASESEKGEAAKEDKQSAKRTGEFEAAINGKGFLIEERDRQLLARVAKGFLGLRYSRGGTSVNGMDCSAFVQKIYRIFGIDLPRTTREQFQIGYTVARQALIIGDLVFFKRGQARRPAHVGIYVGDNQFIHTSLRKGRVEIDSLDRHYFATRFIGARRIEETKEKNY